MLHRIEQVKEIILTPSTRQNSLTQRYIRVYKQFSFLFVSDNRGTGPWEKIAQYCSSGVLFTN